MPTAFRRYAHNPEVMVPWCERVGLDPQRILAQPFAIEHEGRDQHVAVYVQADGENPLDDDAPRTEGRLAVDVLPFPCARHPEVESIGDENGLARRAGYVCACGAEVRRHDISEGPFRATIPPYVVWAHVSHERNLSHVAHDVREVAP